MRECVSLRKSVLALLHSGLERIGTATFDFVADFDRDFDTSVPNYGNKYQLEGGNPDLDEKNIHLYESTVSVNPKSKQ